MNSYFNKQDKSFKNLQKQILEFDQYFGAAKINKASKVTDKIKNIQRINSQKTDNLSLNQQVTDLAKKLAELAKDNQVKPKNLNLLDETQKLVEAVASNDSQHYHLPLAIAVETIETSLANNRSNPNANKTNHNQASSSVVSSNPHELNRLGLIEAVPKIEANILNKISRANSQAKEAISTQTTAWIFDQSFIHNQTITNQISLQNSAIVAQNNIPGLASEFAIEIPHQILLQNRDDSFDFNKFIVKQFIKKFIADKHPAIAEAPSEQLELIVERAVQNSSLRNVIRAIAIGSTDVKAIPPAETIAEDTSVFGSDSTLAEAGDNPQEAIRINTGGPEYTDSQGNVWMADQYFLNGNIGLYPNNPISNTEDDVLYQSERWFRDLAYEIPLFNGNYTVNLHFSETFFDSAESRVFDIAIEDQLVIDDLDIHQSRSNAAFDGQNSAFVIAVPQVEVTDGVLDIDGIASENNVTISAIEIIPINSPRVLINQTNGNTTLTEGFNSDTFSLVLNSRPSADVTIDLRVDNLLEVSTRRLTFTPENFDIPQEIEVSAPDNNALTGTRRVLINSRVSSEDRAFNNVRVPNLAVAILDDEAIEINFTQRVIADIERPTVATWGPDNRLYVGTVEGLIHIYEFDEDYHVINRQTVETVSNQEEATSILGIAFSPFDTSDSPTIYVSRSTIMIELDPNAPDDPLPNPTEFANRVSTLDGDNFENLNDIITGLPVSGFDHGVNGLQFDDNGDLFIAVGGNTDTGFVDDMFRTTVPESPLSGAILRAELSRPDFNGNITYEFVPGLYVPPGADPNDQNNGSLVRVAPGSDVSVYAAGFRNAFDLVFTTEGRLFATDNGSALANDELNLVEEGGFFGHANPARALDDPRQGRSIFDPNVPSSDTFNAPLATFPASTNGLDEFRSNVFGGQLRGSLFAANLFNGNVFNFELSEDGDEVVNTQSFDLGNSLDLVTAPGGAIVGVDFLDNLLRISIPDDESVGTQTIAFDISVSRAAATGGNEFIIAGANFGDIYDTTVTIGDQNAYLTSVSDQRIVGILPSFYRTDDEILDVIVESNGNTSTIEDAFRPLFRDHLD